MIIFLKTPFSSYCQPMTLQEFNKDDNILIIDFDLLQLCHDDRKRILL